MTDEFRNPVPGSKMKTPLGCQDLGPDGTVKGSVCQKQYNALLVLGSRAQFNCDRLHNGCQKGQFLYPRRVSNDGTYFHFHQGIDLGAPDGTPILSVTSGKVSHVKDDWELYKRNKDGSFKEKDGEKVKDRGYGNAVGIYDKARGKLYWYAHCNTILVREGDEVKAGDTIATVGNTGWAGEPHLHFEVAAVEEKVKQPIGGLLWEREIGNKRGPRLDPLEELRALGPWEMTQTFHLVTENVTNEKGDAVEKLQEIGPALVKRLHQLVESSSSGGYYPLGGNSVWHGGVHLPFDKGTMIHAPFDGKIVAARLDADATLGTRAFGSTNFILLRHEIAERVFEVLERGGAEPADGPVEPSPTPTDDAGRAVGFERENRPEDVVEIKTMLHRLTDADGDPFYAEDDVDDPECDDALVIAIARFRLDVMEDRQAFDFVEIPSAAYNRMRADYEALEPRGDAPTVDGDDAPGDEPAPDEPTAPDAPVPKARVIYSLFMHLGAHAIDKLGKHVPWLGEAKLKGEAAEGDEDKESARQAFVAATRARVEGDMAAVVKLDVDVTAGDPLWPSGEAAGFVPGGGTDIIPQIHWEIFSEEKTFDAGWTSHESPDADVTIDMPEQIIDLVEGLVHEKAPGFAIDRILSVQEIAKYYASGNAEWLRRLQCRYRSEWAMDVDLVCGALKDKGWITPGLQGQLQPYVWWTQAGDAVPPPKVWHYNPIEFLGAYQAVLDKFKPPPPYREMPREEFATLVVTVLNAAGGRQPGAVVVLGDGEDARTAKTSARDKQGAGGGEARFLDVPHGLHAIRVETSKIPPTHVFIEPESPDRPYNEITISTDLAGDPNPTGRLTVIVSYSKKTGGKLRVAPGVKMKVASGEWSGSGESDHKGSATFEGVPFGEVQVLLEHEGKQVSREGTMAAKKQKLPLFLDAPMRVLEVIVERHGERVPGALVRVEDSAGDPRSDRRTDGDGVTSFELFEARYRVYCGDVNRLVVTEQTGEDPKGKKQVTLRPSRLLGGLLVTVVDLQFRPLEGLAVVLEHADGSKSHTEGTDAKGNAQFEDLPIGDYRLYAKGYAEQAIDVNIPDAMMLGIPLTIEAADVPQVGPQTGRLEVLLLDTKGKPRAHRMIEASSEEGGPGASAKTGGNGRAIFPALGAGRYRITADDEWVVNEHVDVHVDGEHFVELRTVSPPKGPGSLQVVVRFASGIVGAGLPIELWNGKKKVAEDFTNVAGIVVFTKLKAGTYKALVKGNADSLGEVEVPPEIFATLELTVP